MAAYPFTFSSARQYYGPALESNNPNQEYWTNQPQVPYRTASAGSIAGFGFAAGAIFGGGYLPIGKGKHVWDIYASALRGIEEYSPGKILRTFQLSHLFSPFETAVRKGSHFISPELLSGNTQYTEYLAKLIGETPTGQTYQRLLKEGVKLEGGKLLWGTGQDVALKYATGIAAYEHGAVSQIGAAYARSLGVPRTGGIPLERFFTSATPYLGTENPLVGDRVLQVIGGKSWAQYQYRKASALGTEAVERFNRLLRSPFEIQPFKSILGGTQRFLQNKLGIRHLFDVPQRGGLEMLGQMSLKFGLGLGALSLAYKTADWYAGQSSIFDNTLFDKGITHGLATVGVKAHVAASGLANALGLQAYSQKQEEIAPGSTSLLKLAAFPLMGAMGAAGIGYGLKVAKMARLQISEGLSSSLARKTAEEVLKDWTKLGSFGENLKTIFNSTYGLYGRGDWIGKTMRMLARPTEEGELAYKLVGKLTPFKLGVLGGAALGTLAIAPFIPGALIPSTDPDELRRIYSGEQYVPIRKGRWWEFGRSAYEGTRVQYYRPHAYALMGSDARERAIWGEDYEKMSPIERWYKANFTYHLEAKHYQDRPYPVSGLPFQDVPFVGPLLAGTIGKWIKPQLYMHTDQWLTEQGVKVPGPTFGGRIASELGQSPGGIPERPYGLKDVAGEEIYRVGTELPGLWGFTASAVKERLTGSADWFDQASQLANAGRITSYEREYWEKELGGMAGMSEVWRRLFPHRRRQIDLINPIRNLMPDWLPGPGDKAQDFLHGDPYAAIPYGEIRLPGEGYASLYPELKGVAPEDYPLLHQFKILGDIAPWSDKYKQTLGKVRAKRASKDWSDEDEAIFQTTLSQVKQIKTNKEFQEYRYLSATGNILGPAAEEQNDVLTTINRYKASQQQKPSLFQRFFGGYWELLAHNAETAFDQLTPVSPGAKLVHTRTAIEDYEREQLYGTASAFWSKPVSDFLAPFARSVAKAFGYEGAFGEADRMRNIEQYFDVLEYVKFTRLSNMANMVGDVSSAKEFEAQKNKTLFGVNPFTQNYSYIYNALPKRERDYFESFEQAETYEERERILEMVPENEKSLYAARWKLTHADELKRAIKFGVLSNKQAEQAQVEIDSIYEEAKNEGFPSTKELMAEYWATKGKGETYADWYRRTKILANVEGIPGPDWVGFHPAVDLEDIKFKLVQHLGENPISYNLWPSREKEMAYKPYMTEEVLEPILNPEKLDKAEIANRLQKLLLSENVKGEVFTQRVLDNRGNIEVNIDAEQEMGDEDYELLVRKLTK